jgi:hypothetical protein
MARMVDTVRNRLELALDLLNHERGFDFERFALTILANEIPALRPVGGMHDGARDAFVYAGDAQPDVFVQCSVTQTWAKKIRETVRSLQANGNRVRELIYCTNRSIQADADDLKADLRSKGISLDIRDKGYFARRCDASAAHKAAAVDLAKLVVDPFLVSKGVLEHASLSLSDEAERVATTYLQLELSDRQEREPTKGLGKLCFQSLVLFALRDASPQAPSPRTEIRAQVSNHVYGADAQRTAALVDSGLARLVAKGVVKHHTNVDSFTLSAPYRDRMKQRVEKLVRAEAALQNAAERIVVRVAEDVGIDYEYPCAELAKDAVRILDFIICEQGRLAAVALVGKGMFAAPRESVDFVARKMIADTRQSSFESLRVIDSEKFLDIVPIAVERLAASRDDSVAARLKVIADAYCLRFLLQQTPDVQDAITKAVSGVTLLLDTSIAISAMAERLLPANERRVTRLLLASKGMGCKLVVGEDVLNELDTHLDRIRYNYRSFQGQGQSGKWVRLYSAPMLEIAFQSARKDGRFGGTFDEYIALFKGRDSPKQDLIEYLDSELGAQYVDFSEEIRRLPQAELGTLFEDWRQRKYRRPWVDEAAFETLVMHDVRAFLLVERQRELTLTEGKYGHRWWWLVIDGSAVHFDRLRHGTAVGSRVCMSPEFFARYLSLAVKGLGAADAVVPPAAIHLASLGLVPAELRTEAERIYSSLSDQPEYLRRRRLRDLVNRVIAASTDDEDDSRFGSRETEEASILEDEGETPHGG